ncbi:penicillin-binding protein [Corynebacterium sp. 4HC-13]|nr:penicillin-binding protein [Corynebacterium anserum]
MSEDSARVSKVNTASNSQLSSVGRLLAAILAGGLLCALALAPFTAAGAWMVNSSVETMNSNLQDISANDKLPQTSTITDRNGKPIAWIYKQHRYEVSPSDISQEMKDSIVAIEDRRFYEHNGVDIRGTLRAVLANFASGGVSEGASTINQQYVKNYLLLINAKDDEDRSAAIETSIPRKLREIRMAGDLDDKLSKEEILARYLNLISFGHNAYGIEAAARTYFGIPAKKLNTAQSAFLAGVVQSTSSLDPYTNPDRAKDRRNAVLQARVAAGTLTQADADQAAAQPLGVLKEPRTLPNGCIGAGGSGFFCDYVMDWLAKQGLNQDDVASGGYTIKTTLDPVAQKAAEEASATYVSPQTPGVSEATNFIAPRNNAHEVVAMASSRTYGLDSSKHQTVNPVTHSLQGHGAGSIFKIFPAALAIQDGMGLDTVLAVPHRLEIDGMGNGGADNCPPGKYCVENASAYKSQMTLKEALATSPNTPFVKMLKDVGVKRSVDLAVKLGLRSYAEKGSYNQDTSLADYIKDNNMGSFVLGPTPVNPVELTNVAASIADNGRWCEPLPVLSVTRANGQPVPLKKTPCEQALAPDIAHALANAMGSDVSRGTASAAAAQTGWNGPLSSKTGTTETNYSAAFLGFTPGWAGTSYIFNDEGKASSLCTAPVRQCSTGDLFGGREPAMTFFYASNQAIGAYGGPRLPDYDPKYNRGTNPPAPPAGSGRNNQNQRPSSGGTGSNPDSNRPAPNNRPPLINPDLNGLRQSIEDLLRSFG